jgi:hypothetical protein
MTSYRLVIAGSGNISATAETILAASPGNITMNMPDGLCLIRADITADFLAGVLNGGPTGLILRIYDSSDTSGPLLVTTTIQAEYDSTFSQGVLSEGSWTAAVTHPAGSPGDHAHCITAQQVNGKVTAPFTAVMEFAGTPAGY